jgi:hypothetical protein
VPVPVNALYGSVNFAQGLALNFTLQQGTPEEAQSTVATMTPQLAAVKQMMPFLSKLEMKPEGSDVQVTLSLNSDELKELAPLLQQQLGGMMPGGMMGGPAGMDHGGHGHGEDMAHDEEAPAGEAPEGEEALEAPAGE